MWLGVRPGPDFFDGLGPGGFIPDDTPFGDLRGCEFELGFDQGNDGSSRTHAWDDGRQDVQQRDERKIHHGQIDLFSDVIDGESSAVKILSGVDARVIAQFPDELVGADVEGVDGGGAALEQAVGKSSGAGADIEACHRLDLELKCVQCALEFQAASTDEAGFFLQFDEFIGGDFFARFIGDAGADFDFSGEDQPLGLFA